MVDSSGKLVSIREELRDFAFFALQCERLNTLYEDRLAQGLPDISIDEGFNLISQHLPAKERELDVFFRHWWMGLDDASFLGQDSLYSWLGEDENYDYLYDSNDPEGNGADVLANGYGELASRLAAPLDIRLNQTVVRIEHSDREATVHTSSGQSFTGSNVIVTVPLGVLRGESRRLAEGSALSIDFEPALSDERVEAMYALGVGLETHYYVLRDADLSHTAGLPYVVGYMASPPLTGALLPAWYDGAYEWSRPLKSAASDSSTTETTTTGPVPVDAMAHGEWARTAEYRSIAAVARDVATVNNLVYNNTGIAQGPFLQSMWWTDPMSQGSYTYYRVNNTRDTRDTAFDASDDAPRVLFAGEHTCDLLYGTVVGAFVSGVRASQAILGDNQNKSWVYFEDRFSKLCDQVMDSGDDDDADADEPQRHLIERAWEARYSASVHSRRSFARLLAHSRTTVSSSQARRA
jgi:hypothetical protein